jgi:hypothetical protein
MFISNVKRSIICSIILFSLAVFGRYASAQALNWDLQLYDTAIRVSGQVSHSGVGAATYQNRLYVAYSDHSGDGHLWLTYRIDPYNYSQPVQVPGAVVNNNPQLAVYNNILVISWADPNGLLYITGTTDGVNFSNITQCQGMTDDPYSSIWDSPSMAVMGSTLYIGFRTPKGTLSICRVVGTDPQHFSTWAGGASGFPALSEAPGLGTFNGKLYIAYKDATDSHYIYLGETTDGVDFTFSNAAIGNHTSSQPSIAVYNGILYIGYRQNSDDRKFYYTYSIDGETFFHWSSASFSMGGPPALVVGPDGYFYNIFSKDSGDHYLSTAVAQ